MKKWVLITCTIGALWLIVFAILNRRQTPHEDSAYEHPVLSKATRAILDGSEKFVLVSIDPKPPGLDLEVEAALRKDAHLPAAVIEAPKDHRERFHDYPILGRTEIRDPKRKSELLGVLYRGLEKDRGSVPACFEPRHGIIASKGTNWVELVICFECEQVAEYTDSGHGWSLISKRMSKEARELFNGTLGEAGVPLAKQ
jgi:hypothetical protein